MMCRPQGRAQIRAELAPLATGRFAALRVRALAEVGHVSAHAAESATRDLAGHGAAVAADATRHAGQTGAVIEKDFDLDALFETEVGVLVIHLCNTIWGSRVALQF
jgi:hypothetical protein